MTGLSLTQAAQRTGRSRRTIGRLLADGKIPGAELRETVWSIPLEGLASAGLLDDKPKEKQKPVEDVADDSQPLTWRERALVAEAKVQSLEVALEKTENMDKVLQGLTETLSRLSQRSLIETTAQPFTRTVPDMTTEPVVRPAPKAAEQDRRRGWFGRK